MAVNARAVGASGAHLGGHPYRFHQLLTCGAVPECGFGVPLDAVWALRHVRDRNRDQLLGFDRQRTVGEHLTAEGLKGFLGVGSQRTSLLGKLSR